MAADNDPARLFTARPRPMSLLVGTRAGQVEGTDEGMLLVHGLETWRRRCVTIVAAFGLSAALLAAPLAPSVVPRLSAAPTAPQRLVSVIVQTVHPGLAAGAVERHGGRVTTDLPLVDGAVADVPADAVPALRADPAVRQVSPN